MRNQKMRKSNYIKVEWTNEESGHVKLGNEKLRKASLAFSLVADENHEAILNTVYRDTNLYCGDVWEIMNSYGLPEDRPHTALSVGDKVTINDDTYRCADFGWELI